MTTSREMLDQLRAHYAGTPSKPIPGYFAEEIQAPDSARRADGLWLPLATSARGQIIGHEVKVSRQDVMVELADPMKAEAWGQFCDRWWLVVPDIALLRDLDIPDSWGIMTSPAKGKRLMTIVRPAPLRKPNRDRLGYATVLTRIFYQGDDQGTKLRSLERQLEAAHAQTERAENREQALIAEMRAAGVRTSAPSDQVEARLRKLADAMVDRWGYDRPIDYQAMAQLATITDDEALDILFDTARARARVDRINQDARDRLRWLDMVLDGAALRDVRAALRAGPE